MAWRAPLPTSHPLLSVDECNYEIYEWNKREKSLWNIHRRARLAGAAGQGRAKVWKFPHSYWGGKILPLGTPSRILGACGWCWHYSFTLKIFTESLCVLRGWEERGGRKRASVLISDCLLPVHSVCFPGISLLNIFPTLSFPLMVVLLITGCGAGVKQGCKRYSWESRGRAARGQVSFLCSVAASSISMETPQRCFPNIHQ